MAVRFPVGQRRGITIPQTALIERGELHEVWIVEPGEVLRMRYVTPGVVSADQVEIITGLSSGERFVVDARQRMTDGSHVVSSASPRSGS